MLTPIELQGKVFKTGFGYDKKDVEAFLKEVVDDYESLYKENLDLNDKINVLSEGVQYYKSIEKTLQKALVLAEKTAQDTEAAASKRAEALILDAEKKASMIQQEALSKADSITTTALNEAKLMQLDARKTLDQLKLQITSLVQQFEHYKIQYKQLLTTQTELLEKDAFILDLTSLKEQLSSVETEETSVEITRENTTYGDTDDSYEESTNTQQNQYIIRDIAPDESQVFTENTSAKETIQTNDMTKIDTKPADDYDDLPTIDLASIMAEAKKEAEEETQTETDDNTDYDYVNHSDDQEEVSEQDLLDQLFSVNPKKKTNKKNISGTADDFEFLDI